MEHVFISDYNKLEEIKTFYRKKGRFLKNSSELSLPGIFFVQNLDKDYILKKVEPELINSYIKYYEDSWK